MCVSCLCVRVYALSDRVFEHMFVYACVLKGEGGAQGEEGHSVRLCVFVWGPRRWGGGGEFVGSSVLRLGWGEGKREQKVGLSTNRVPGRWHPHTRRPLTHTPSL